MTSRRWWMLVVGLAACTAVLPWAAPAAAHPWGVPPEAVVAGEGDRVVVQWKAEPDDALLVGVELGLVDPVLLDWTWDGPEAAGSSDEPLLPASPALSAHLLDHIRVLQDGVPCEGVVEPFADFVVAGATTVHTCPEPVAVVELEISMLHDLHEAYRTFARSSGGAQPRQAVFTSATPRHTWSFGEAASAHRQRDVWLQPAAAVGLAALVAGLAAHRRRRRGPRRPARAHPPAGTGGSPRQIVRTGTYGIVPIVVLAAAEPQRFGWLESEFVRLIDMEAVGVAVGALALVVAFGIGAAHALAPGHGKGLISAYLVGTRGRPSDALLLGSIVALMHCGSVLVLGGVLFTTVSLQADVGRVMPWMSVAAGALVTVVGAGLVIRQGRRRARRPVLAGASGTVPHDHGPGHTAHAADHAHQHLAEDVRPLSRRGVVALGASGGLLPSPSAFLVLATAILLGRALFGLLLVVAFSLGLAATLTVFGLAAIKGRTLVERGAAGSPRLARLTAVLPLISSVAVLAGGVWMTTMALLRV